MRTLRLSGSLFSLCAGPGVALAIVGADLLFPDEYVGLAPAAVVLAGGSLVVSSAAPIVAIYFSRRRPRPQLLAAAVALTTNVVLALALIPAFGLSGAVAANAIGAVIYAGVLVVPIMRQAGALRIPVTRYLRTVCAAVATSVMLGTATVALLTGPARWAVAASLGAVHTIAMARFAQSIDRTDVAVLRAHAPRRFAWAIDLLDRVASAPVPKRDV
jgi:O-antigen/teichoic acid export membrane protein